MRVARGACRGGRGRGNASEAVRARMRHEAAFVMLRRRESRRYTRCAFPIFCARFASRRRLRGVVLTAQASVPSVCVHICFLIVRCFCSAGRRLHRAARKAFLKRRQCRFHARRLQAFLFPRGRQPLTARAGEVPSQERPVAYGLHMISSSSDACSSPLPLPTSLPYPCLYRVLPYRARHDATKMIGALMLHPRHRYVMRALPRTACARCGDEARAPLYHSPCAIQRPCRYFRAPMSITRAYRLARCAICCLSRNIGSVTCRVHAMLRYVLCLLGQNEHGARQHQEARYLYLPAYSPSIPARMRSPRTAQ